jgi:hypothetical protein
MKQLTSATATLESKQNLLKTVSDKTPNADMKRKKLKVSATNKISSSEPEDNLGDDERERKTKTARCKGKKGGKKKWGKKWGR